jgi:hypothetical protein
MITFSDIIKANELIRILDNKTGEELFYIIPDKQEYSNTVTIKLDKSRDIRIEPVISKHLVTGDILKLSNTICFTKHNLHFPIIHIKDNISHIEENYLKPHQKEFLESQIKVIDNLLSYSTSFLEYAHYRKAQILNLLEKLEKDNIKTYQTQVKQQYDILKENSKRMKSVYEELLKLKID